jgi:membrane-associated protein
MELLKTFVNYVLHVDVFLTDILRFFGGWAYAIIFLVIFCETGLVVTPFLPGDSLLFATGAFSAAGAFGLGGSLSNAEAAFALGGGIAAAAIIGDTVNYWLGRKAGPAVFARFINQKYLDRTKAFYERHGGKTIIIARFMPIIRTFSPFVAGIGQIPYPRFIAFSLVGGLSWVTICVGAGYWFGNLEFVKKHFTLVILAIVFVSVMPAFIGFLREKLRKKD